MLEMWEIQRLVFISSVIKYSNVNDQFLDFESLSVKSGKL